MFWFLTVASAVLLLVLLLGNQRRQDRQQSRQSNEAPISPPAVQASPTIKPAKKPSKRFVDYLTDACSATGLVEPDAAKWMSKTMAPMLDTGLEAVARAIRNTGDPLSKEEKKELGLRANVKVGHTYLAALTARGREEAYNAAFLVAQRALHSHSIDGIISDARAASDIIRGLEVVAAHDDRNCSTIKAYDGKVFALDELPILPLPECDAEYCRCIFVAVTRDLG